MTNTPNFELSHLELRVADIERMERFYTEVLGFIATDRGEGANAMVFLSRSPDEHHQIVLSPGGDGAGETGALDHFALRVDSLGALKRVHQALKMQQGISYETVSHGTTWSFYLRDPEGNRLEIFTNTPWHVAQPVRFEVDLGLSDQDLIHQTEDAIRTRRGFRLAKEWQLAHRERIDS